MNIFGLEISWFWIGATLPILIFLYLARRNWSPSRTGIRTSSDTNQLIKRFAILGAFGLLYWLGDTAAELLHGVLSQIPNIPVPSVRWLQTIIMVGAVLGIASTLWALLVPITARDLMWQHLAVIVAGAGLLFWALPLYDRIEAEKAYAAACPEQDKLHLWSGNTSGERLLCTGMQNRITVSNTPPNNMRLEAVTINFAGGESIPASEFDASRLKDMCYFRVRKGWEVVSRSNCTILSHRSGHAMSFFGVNRDSARAARIESISFRAEYEFR